MLTAPGVQPSVPQWQKSKGCLILTAALELSANQVTHFYSTAKNTDEMVRMANALLERYADAGTLYLSWDAASWHLSKKLTAFIDEHNATAQASHRPLLELAPLPASAQFLNVIESVFSGMARAIIHNSDYESVDAAMSAIDRYFLERNQHFEAHPKRAGKAIWGLERTACEFSDANNCKDPAFFFIEQRPKDPISRSTPYGLRCHVLDDQGRISQSFSFGRTVYTIDDETTENGRQIVHALNDQFEFVRRYMDGGLSAVPAPELVPTEVSFLNSYRLWQRTNRKLLAEGNVAATALARATLTVRYAYRHPALHRYAHQS